MRLIVVCLVLLLTTSLCHAAPDAKHEIIGHWVCAVDHNRPVEFRSGTSCSVGFFMEKGKWQMAKGTYKIDASGEVVAVTHFQGATLTEHYRLKDGVLHGIRGGFGNPNVSFKKTSK